MSGKVNVKKFRKVLVANRGEIAIRIFRALSELGITTVSIYSKEDRYAMFRSKADESYPLNPQKGPIDAYLDIDTIIKIALSTGVDAIHPGYGFLSENPDFADACERNGIVFIGPGSNIMNAMGDKISSKKIAIEANVPIIPGVDYAIKEVDEAKKIAAQVGYPVMLKASNGGGGRGMRIVNREEDLEKEFNEAKNESKKAFGDDMIFIEKYLKGPKHIEVQIVGDNYGNVVHLYDRDCSVQRRHQKVVEYAPAFSIPETVRQEIFDASIRLAKTVGYRNAGTLEFLVDADNHPYFIEMNPRIQVEHTVSEMVTDIDIVQTQILIAEGYPLASEEIAIPSQESVTCTGYSIQTRVTTEDLHTHDSTGNGVSTVLMAAEAGVDIVDLAIESMSSMTSQPSMNAVVEALRGTKRDTGLDFEELSELSRYYNRIRSVYAPFESDMKSPNTEIYKYEIPGGQYSNLLAQVTEMGSPEEFEAIKGLYKEANDLLGNIVKVTPTSKAVGDLAIFMYKNNLNKDNILTAGASLSYPDSVVSYFRGMMGQPYGGFPKELQKIVLKDIEPLTERPGKLLPPEDLEGIKKHLIEKYHYEDKSEEVMAQKAISYALYPKVYEDYCEHFEMYNDVTRLESHVYFYGLRKGEETYLKIGEGKELLIKYLEQSDLDENGIRTLSFQVNGSIRTVKIQDHNLEIKTDRRLKADKNNPQHLGSSIPGTVDKVLVKEGDVVTKNMPLMTIEAMKMETTVVSTVNGTVDKIYVEAGDSVHQDDLLVSFHIKE